jgi:hypothetical protein
MNIDFFKDARCRVVALAWGLMLACTVPPEAFAQSCYNNTNANLVQNGDFESGDIGFIIPKWHVRWTGTLSDGSMVDPNVQVGNGNPHNGAKELDLGTTFGANDIFQAVRRTTAGALYTVCFWLASAPDPLVGKTSLEVLWNDVNELELIQSGPSLYQYYTFVVSANGTNDHLRFRERNDQGYYYLDDVAVQLCTGCTSAPRFKKK